MSRRTKNVPLPGQLPSFALLLAMTCSGTALAQDLGIKAAPQRQTVVLDNAVVHTMAGPILIGAQLRFAGGVITAVHPAGEAPPLPSDGETVVLDLRGRSVYPGLIAAQSQLGLLEIGMVKQTVDVDEVGDLTPEALASVAVNPDSTAIPVARSNGVLVAGVFPSGGLLPGRVSVLQLDGWTNQDLTVRRDAGVVVQWPEIGSDGGPRRGGRPRTAGDPIQRDPLLAARRQRDRIEAAFTDANSWLAARLADSSVAIDVRAEALVPALRGETAVFVLADELEQIESAVLWAQRSNLRMVLVGGRDAALCSELLRQRQVPVVVTGTHKLPRRDDSGYDEPFTLPARLAAAGVRFCIATGDNFSNDRNLPYHAATAAAFGLDRTRALAAITIDAAAILGVDDRLGSLVVGKDATLLVTDGDPLDLTTRVELAFVRGRQVDLRNKQTELARKYREKYLQLAEPK